MTEFIFNEKTKKLEIDAGYAMVELDVEECTKLLKAVKTFLSQVKKKEKKKAITNEEARNMPEYFGGL